MVICRCGYDMVIQDSRIAERNRDMRGGGRKGARGRLRVELPQYGSSSGILQTSLFQGNWRAMFQRCFELHAGYSKIVKNGSRVRQTVAR